MLYDTLNCMFFLTFCIYIYLRRSLLYNCKIVCEFQERNEEWPHGVSKICRVHLLASERRRETVPTAPRYSDSPVFLRMSQFDRTHHQCYSVLPQEGSAGQMVIACQLRELVRAHFLQYSIALFFCLIGGSFY